MKTLLVLVWSVLAAHAAVPASRVEENTRFARELEDIRSVVAVEQEEGKEGQLRDIKAEIGELETLMGQLNREIEHKIEEEVAEVEERSIGEEWTLYPNHDCYGNDLKEVFTATLRECQAVCQGEAGCIAVAHSVTHCQKGHRCCWLKRTACDPRPYTGNTVDDITVAIRPICDLSPCVNGGSCKPLADGDFSCQCPQGFSGKTCEREELSWRVYRDHDCAGNDIRDVFAHSFSECQAHCQAEAACIAIAYARKNCEKGHRCCWLKRDVCDPRPYTGNMDGGVDVAVRPERCWCNGWGDPHYTTCDGVKIDWQGPCTYQLAGRQAGDRPDLDFQVLAKNQPCGSGHSQVTCTHYVVVLYAGYRVTLGQARAITVTSPGSAGAPVPVSPGTDFPMFSLSLHGGFVRFTSSNGEISAEFDGHATFNVFLGSILANKTDGICGNYDGIAANDLDRDLNGWQRPDPDDKDCEGDGNVPHPCEEDPEREVAGRRLCDVLTSQKPENPFLTCIQTFPDEAARVVEGCVYDHCAGVPDACGAAEELAAFCADNGATVGAGWRLYVNCPLACPPGQEYRPSGPACPAACGKPDAPAQCDRPDTEGCFCPEGTILGKNELCLPPDQCPCFDPALGVDFKPGDSWLGEGCDREFTCAAGGVILPVERPGGCDGGGVCQRVPGGGYQCVDPPTESPTNPPTNPPTRPPTELPTNPPAEPPTEPPTNPPTDPPTDPPTEPPTEPPTNPPIEPPINPPTDPCHPSPCLNKGVCVAGRNGTFQCACPDGYFGKLCEKEEKPCEPNPCENGGECRCLEDCSAHVCVCRPGFSGANCEVPVDCDPCTPNPCHNLGLCRATVLDEYECVCDEGYSGKKCETPDETCCEQSTDPCEEGACGPHGACEPMAGGNSFHCLCEEGFLGQHCEVVDPCSPLAGSPACENDGRCLTDLLGSFLCQCTEGYSGDRCQTKGTVDNVENAGETMD